MEFKEIWETLKKVDVSNLVKIKEVKSQKTNRVTRSSYISWADAWEVIMSYYPCAQYEILPNEEIKDGSVIVWTSLSIGEHTRKMWLPVMGYGNNADKSPDSRGIGDARMRCLVKNLAVFGLAIYLYQGEDIPREESIKDVQKDDLKEGTDEFDRAVARYKKDKNLNRVKNFMRVSKDVEKAIIKKAKESVNEVA